jgi:UDP-N-acetylmuramoyl-L-alanyl-D-glutamate--2,6-diaminopimelate ligase
LLGRHNIYNALAAIGTGLLLDVPPVVLQAALNALPPVPGRLERVDAGQPFSVLVDYARSEDGLRNALCSLRECTAGRLLLLFGCGGEGEPGLRPRMGRVAAESADLTMITADNPRRESSSGIAEQIEQGYRTVRTDGCLIELDRAAAIGQLIDMAQPGDTILLAGKGHETYQELDDTVIPFDDRFHARAALELLGYGRRWSEPTLCRFPEPVH